MDSSSLVTVSHSATAVTYQIHEKNLFDMQGFKTLQRHYDSGFAKCSKGSINGVMRLSYDVSGLVTLTQFVHELDNQSFLKLTFHLLKTALALREIGFLQRENISIKPTDIYIDKQTMNTYLIYVPLNIHTAPNAHMKFEKKLRELLAQVGELKFKKHKTDFVQEIKNDLLNVRVSIGDIVSKIETQALQTTEENTRKVSERMGVADTKSYTPFAKAEKKTPPQKVPQAEATHAQVKAPAENRMPAQPVPKPVAPQKVRRTEEEKKLIKSQVIFLVVYCLFFFAAIGIIAHYYSNSGMTVQFLCVTFALLLLVIAAPVLFFMKKNKKENPSSLVNPVLLDTPRKSVGFQHTIVLKNISSELRIEFFINKEEFTIGKVENEVDGYIPFDKTISDKHCKIVWDGKFYILDLGSAYGTFVNEDQIIPGQKFPLRNGDRVRLNKHVFQVMEI